ncbi:DNA topology modulation protein FlaR [uncultured Ruegeria sp.]|uniref:DNA topology modulation protein FlaR n=1 Tax=uncultured Ruegeria sp. TaxID=259304 RepID=UPI0026098565|nr:DNA topology modulation protein FlaR [uncultured Ruegeria sp.]
MRKIIITGSNGVGKSSFASELSSARPEIPVVSFDAVKLRTGWQQRARLEIDAALAQELENKAWILEGGPSLLPQAVSQADALVWLDPPELVRAWQIAARPWKFLGKTRPELPPENVDWPWQQYKFALRSLRNRSNFRKYISAAFRSADGLEKWRCHNKEDRAAVLRKWAQREPD